MERTYRDVVTYRFFLLAFSVVCALVLTAVLGSGLASAIAATNACFVMLSIVFRVQSYIVSFAVAAITSILVPLLLIALLSGMDHRSIQSRQSNTNSSSFAQLADIPSTYAVIPMSLGLHCWFLFVFRSLRKTEK